MEISIIDKNSLKIKTKKSTFIINPSATMQKTPADAVLFIDQNEKNIDKVTDYRLLIDGQGEYEIGGTKISGIKVDEKIVYSMLADGIETVIGKVSVLNKLSDKFQETSVAVLDLDDDLAEILVTTIEPRIALIYGQKIEEGLKVLGKDLQSVEKIKKININEGKLPEEMQVAILGS
ncbi:MAG: hypothetical protein M1450_04355, partial [Patescibacteria group bacterium]|nr:hypothetical protein [Patescibacteria group bacterium]